MCFQPTWLHCRLAFSPASGDIHVCCCEFRWSGTGKRYSNRNETSCFPLHNAGFESGSLKNLFARRLNAHSQTEWAIKDPVKNLNSTARPYDEWAFSPLDFTVVWLSHHALPIYMFVVVNVQASDIRVDRGTICLPLLNVGFEPGNLKTPFRQQTDCPLTNRLCHQGSSLNLKSTVRPYYEWAFSPLDLTAVGLSLLALAIYMFVVVNFDAQAQQAIFGYKGDKLSSSAWCRIRTWKSQDTYSPADWLPTHESTEISRISFNSTVRPYAEWAFNPLDFTAVWL